MSLVRFALGLLPLASQALALPRPQAVTEDATSDEYDFIVVGGGTAGNAVAARLSQYLEDCSVLVIEAGPAAYDEERINIPGKKGSTLGGPLDWNFTSIEQPQLNDRVITQSRGKVLGGTSAINLLIWDRASSPEYDGWQEVQEDTEDEDANKWGWNTMIEAMNKAENFTKTAVHEYTGTTGYGEQGPINAVVNRYIPRHQEFWNETFNNLGVESNTNWLGGDNVGAAYHSSTIDPGNWTRSYSAIEYLPRAPKLHIRTETRVAKVNLEPEGEKFKATGVTLLNGDVIKAAREVIVSAGTIQSPPLLELSGIGSADVLEAAGVEQKIKLPGVGENLQDHPRIQIAFQLKDNYTSFDKLKVDKEYEAEQLQLWKDGKTGAYDYAASAYSYQSWNSVLGDEKEAELVEAAKRVTSELKNVVDDKKLEWISDPDLKSKIAEAEFLLSDGYSGIKGYPKADDPLYGKGFTTIFAALMHPLARGSVHIGSDDVTDKPLYNPAYASNEYDLMALVEMMKFVRKMANTAPFSSVWDAEYEPGLSVQTDAEWETWVRNNVNPFYHPVGSCPMLPRADGGVVSTDLKVYDTTNLRVVDASVIPILVSAHPQTGIYGIAERAAEIIRDAHLA